MGWRAAPGARGKRRKGRGPRGQSPYGRWLKVRTWLPLGLKAGLKKGGYGTPPGLRHPEVHEPGAGPAGEAAYVDIKEVQGGRGGGHGVDVGPLRPLRRVCHDPG